MTARILLLGVNSVLGGAIAQQLTPEQALLLCNQHTRVPAGHVWRPLNLQNRAGVRELFDALQPALIIHGAGICNVEKCEKSPEFAHEVNVVGMDNLLRYAPASARLVYLSSDHVFSGNSGGPYRESSTPDPISTYGRTRVLAERMLQDRRPDALIVRSGLWVGPSITGRMGHLDWLRYRTARGLPTTIVTDEYRSAMWAKDAAERVLQLAASPLRGIRHVVASRIVARSELASYLDRRYDIGARISLITRADRPVPHLGRVDLRTEHNDALARPLTPVVPNSGQR